MKIIVFQATKSPNNVSSEPELVGLEFVAILLSLKDAIALRRYIVS